MPQVSQVSRYRPAVIAVTGLAAAYATWTLWSTFSKRPSDGNSLQRRRAVHRRRPRQPLVLLEGPSNPGSYGTLLIKPSSGTERTLEIGIDRIPTAASLQQDFECEGDILRRCLCKLAIEGILSRAEDENDPDEEQLRQRLEADGLRGVANAVAHQQDIELSLRYRSHISAILGGQVPQTLFDEAFMRFHNPTQNGNGSAADAVAVSTVGPAETEDQMSDGDDVDPSQGLKGLLYYIAEETAKRNAYEHRGINCDECGECPIRHVRYRCLNCPDYDLCATCEASTEHAKTHLFVKIKIPVPTLSQPAFPMELWYPGDPQQIHRSINPALRKRLATEHNLEEPQIDAMYDQFACTANVRWEGDPSGVRAGINRRAFDKALSSQSWPNRNAPNVLFDRMFAFYDTSLRGVILFEDFVRGIAYLRGEDRLHTIERALQGFDFDGDRLLDRSDFLRMFRAKYAISRQITIDAVNAHNVDLTTSAADILRSSQPISSVFSQEDIPPGEHRVPTGKQSNDFGDMEPAHGSKAVLEDGEQLDDGPKAAHDNVMRVRSLQQLTQQLSRLDDILSGAVQRNGNGQDNPSDTSAQQAASLLSEAERTALGINESFVPTKPPLERDVFWQFLEQTLNEMLDPLFKAKERLHDAILKTRSERRDRRQAIDDMLMAKKAFEEKLRSDAAVDPLMATALESYDQPDQPDAAPVPQQQDVQSYMRDAMVPTDTESLEKFESEIQHSELDDLLSSAGYSIAEPAAEQPLRVSVESAGAAAEQGSRRSRITILAPVTFPEETVDPTLPQNRPDSVSEGVKGGPQEATENAKAAPDEPIANGHTVEPYPPPTKERLEYLASLDDEEKVLTSRGAPGRMSFDEIEGIVNADKRDELRGLVTHWLEWASF